MAVAGVRAKEPPTMRAMNGRPKRRNGRLASIARYCAANVLDSAAEMYFFLPNTAMVPGGRGLDTPSLISCELKLL